MVVEPTTANDIRIKDGISRQGNRCNAIIGERIVFAVLLVISPAVGVMACQVKIQALIKSVEEVQLVVILLVIIGFVLILVKVVGTTRIQQVSALRIG